MAVTRRPEWYLHLQYSCRISHLPSISDSEGVVGDLQVELLKVDLDHLKYKPTKKDGCEILCHHRLDRWMDGWKDSHHYQGKTTA